MTTPLTTPALTLREAVEATGASLSTMRRRVREGAFPGAFVDDTGARRVPVLDLLGAGFTLDNGPAVTTPDQGLTLVTAPTDQGSDHPSDHPVTTPDDHRDQGADHPSQPEQPDSNEVEELQHLRLEVVDLRDRTLRAEAAREQAEAVADERERALHRADRDAESLRLALRALTATVEQQQASAPIVLQAAPEPVSAPSTTSAPTPQAAPQPTSEPASTTSTTLPPVGPLERVRRWLGGR